MPGANSKTPLLGNNSSGGSNKKPPVSRPKYQRRRSSFEASTYNSQVVATSYTATKSHGEDTNIPGLHLLQLLTLTVCMAGVQFTWTVELSYGTPYLLSLDLSKELTALVWLAGPLSGLIVQPVIGAFSDKCTSKFGKRRPFIVVAGILTCLSMVGVAYAKEIGYWFAEIFATSSTSMDRMESIKQAAHTNAIIVAVASFYFLDFTLNAVQAICRALILDIPPLWQQDIANAWSARMSNTAMVIGYFVGFVDLVKYLPWLGDSQVKVFCIVAIVVFVLTLGITCVTTKEKTVERKDDAELNQPWYSTFYYIWRAFRFLPRPIQTLCNTQFFAWMGWFPFLFYSTQWVSDIYFATHPPRTPDEPLDWAQGTRAGSFALLCYSVVSVLAGLILPAIVSSKWAIHRRWMNLLNIYTLSHLTVAFALISSLFVESVAAATVVLAIMGVPWAIVLWIPFSLVGEFVSYEDEKRNMAAVGHHGAIQQSSSHHHSTPHEEESQQNNDEFDAGMILGVHNMYIVFPQFAVAIISSFIFAAADAIKDGNNRRGGNMSSVTPVLIFGGLMAIVAAALSRFIVRVSGPSSSHGVAK
ncbi:major facilitator superfamily domain-containing protein [Mycotypha africana]|uniref:major facilitator superfamily domain-containing protein n=1 Tax=Mycotypha africana TaxID=64632 RepID=UPI0023016C63|nr:major facilitator superfamily domain-containing protein [Mycotypha africana]KAI8973613.1 major facilitator superfamily domain-containing protein [Mycotypha africana]